MFHEHDDLELINGSQFISKVHFDGQFYGKSLTYVLIILRFGVKHIDFELLESRGL